MLSPTKQNRVKDNTDEEFKISKYMKDTIEFNGERSGA